VNPGPAGPVYVANVAGPALPCPTPTARPPVNATLASRLRAYPPEVEAALARYCRWRLNAWLDQLHADAAVALGVDKVCPLGADLDQLARDRLGDPTLADLYMISGPVTRPVALPRDGAAAFFQACRRRLEALGVRLYEHSPAAARSVLAAFTPGDVIVWTASPAPLFAALDLAASKPTTEILASHLFRAQWTGAAPLRLRNFTATGAVARLQIRSHRGENPGDRRLYRWVSDSDLRRELHVLTTGAPGDLLLGDTVGVSIRSQSVGYSLEAARCLAALRAALARRFGAAFVPGAWEARRRPERFTTVAAGLAEALMAPDARAVA